MSTGGCCGITAGFHAVSSKHIDDESNSTGIVIEHEPSSLHTSCLGTIREATMALVLAPLAILLSIILQYILVCFLRDSKQRLDWRLL